MNDGSPVEVDTLCAKYKRFMALAKTRIFPASASMLGTDVDNNVPAGYSV